MYLCNASAHFIESSLLHVNFKKVCAKIKYVLLRKNIREAS